MKETTRSHPLFLGVLVAALLVPAYIGFRLPNYWSTSLALVNSNDGFYRRAAFGTVFKPLWAIFDFAYSTFAVTSVLLLLALLACIVVAASKATNDSQRLVALLWILAPTGAFLFHIVGYLDILLYLALFAAILLVDRNHPWWATAVMASSAFIHENMLLATLPVFLYRVMAAYGPRKAFATCLAPVAAVVAVVLMPQIETAKREIALAKWDSAVEFPIRYDAINLQARSLSDAWQLYSVWDVSMWVIPIAVGIVIGWVLLIVDRNRVLGTGVALGLVAMAASLAPLALGFLGWDASRWNFLALSNFALIAFAWLNMYSQRLNLLVAVGCLMPFLPLFYQPLAYFDEVSPRAIAPQVVVQYLKAEVPEGFFSLPKA
jgi:hypothetical protein